MIDTDKYEGHLAYLDYELWAFTDFMDINATHEERCATDALLNDAPLLLEAYKRLREEKYQLRIKISDVKRWMSLAPSVTQQTIDRLFPEDVIE